MVFWYPVAGQPGRRKVTDVKLSPATKYTLARVGMFVVLALALTPLHVDLLLRLMIALVVTAVASWFLLAKWRDEMADTIGRSMAQRKEEKERLRAALAGDEEREATGN